MRAGVRRQAIAAGIDRLACVPGRFERVECGQPFTVVVDYAHTDDALRNLTALARELVSGREGTSADRVWMWRGSRPEEASVDGRGCGAGERFRGADVG